MAEVCHDCKRSDGTHTSSCRRKKGCKHCAKRAPDKCPYHGGVRKTPNGGGKRRAKAKPARSRPAVRNGAQAAADTPLAKVLEDLRRRRDKLGEAISILEGLDAL